MRIVFFGTSNFAIPSLIEIISSGHDVAAVVTRPDKKSGRSLKLSPPPTKVLALTHNIPVFQSGNLSEAEPTRYLKGLKADLFVVVSFGQILGKGTLSIPRLFAVNLHGSLLPKYRGAAPTNWAIINGEKTSGITIIRMNEKMDEGDIIVKKEISLDPEETNITLGEKLSELGAKTLVQTITAIEKNENINFSKQDPALATYAPKLRKEDGLIKWDYDEMRIHNAVRGLLPWPGAYTYYYGKIVKILRTEIGSCGARGVSPAKPGQVIDIIEDKGIIVATGRDPIAVTHLQLEGKKAMDAASFLRGHKLGIGYVFS